MFTQDNNNSMPSFLNNIKHEAGQSDPIEAADMVVEAAQEDLSKSCVVGLYIQLLIRIMLC